jgi:DNA-directed RNA polymerase subunit beta'
MTLGQYELNKVLPDRLKDYTRKFSGKDIEKFLTKLGKEETPTLFEDVINHYKDLGANYAYYYGASLSLNDLAIDRSYRDKIYAKSLFKIDGIKDPAEKIKATLNMLDEIEVEQNKYLASTGNRMHDLIEGGALSKSKGGNVKQVLTAPGLVADQRGRVIATPILKSWSEGVDTFSYFNTMPGVRKGVVDKGINTQDTGALNKSLIAVTRSTLIVEDDCETKKFIESDLNSFDAMDRYAAETVFGVVARNEVIDGDVVQKAKKAGLLKLKVRSPLTCETSAGICSKCYGLMPDGRSASIGTNVGTLESQSISERATQLTLRTFHCLHPDSTLFVDSNKLVRIEDLWHLIDGEMFITERGEEAKYIPNLRLWDGGLMTKVYQILRHKPDTSIIKITLSNGASFIAQNSHPTMVKNRGLVEGKDIVIGDKLYYNLPSEISKSHVG